MPGVEIKAAVKSLLEQAFVGPTGDGRIKRVDTQYPRSGQRMQPAELPKVVVFNKGHATETRKAGGSNVFPYGLKEVKWNVLIHVATLINNPDDEEPGWSQLLDDLEAQLRQTLNLKELADTGSTRVMLTDSMQREDLPPIAGDQIGYNTFITVTVEEWIAA